MRIYYTLIIWNDDNDVWYPDFGDYSKNAVYEEGLNYHNSAWCVIATLDDKQESINEVINEMNKEYKYLDEQMEDTY